MTKNIIAAFADDMFDESPHGLDIHLLPNFCYSSRTLNPEGVILHYFSAIYARPKAWNWMDTCWNLFHDLNLPSKDRKNAWKVSLGKKRSYASAHFLIARDGTINNLVPVTKKAFHAGKSLLGTRRDCNSFTWGIEMIAAPQDSPDKSFTNAQYKSAAWLCKSFDVSMIKGHDEVRDAYLNEVAKPNSKIAVKNDPGITFNWPLFYAFLKEYKNAD